MGLVNPCIILIKILIQKLWSLKLTWDERVPADLQQIWLKFKDNLVSLNQLKVTRHVCKNATIVEIHGFCDASCVAYAGSVYLRSIDNHGNVHVHLISSKTKVAPLKQKLTVPKLELSGALLLVRLTNRIINAFTLKGLSCFMWSDSQIVLTWIKTNPKLLPRFEANRIAEIQKLSQNYIWS
ncbi:hypothetical protein ILUMI_04679 [Ignelater luminosus]|uniref:RNase H type-1 domain-containing protein n=1 Tax=Ignelater luminosus TaxID=2038154 RepID=A0A8K0DCD7_IGNLU|nr:hypothetical protein ILUMI_04679 [Ignelater luminosus]